MTGICFKPRITKAGLFSLCSNDLAKPLIALTNSDSTRVLAIVRYGCPTRRIACDRESLVSNRFSIVANLKSLMQYVGILEKPYWISGFNQFTVGVDCTCYTTERRLLKKASEQSRDGWYTSLDFILRTSDGPISWPLISSFCSRVVTIVTY